MTARGSPWRTSATCSPPVWTRWPPSPVWPGTPRCSTGQYTSQSFISVLPICPYVSVYKVSIFTLPCPRGIGTPWPRRAAVCLYYVYTVSILCRQGIYIYTRGSRRYRLALAQACGSVMKLAGVLYNLSIPRLYRVIFCLQGDGSKLKRIICRYFNHLSIQFLK